MVLHFLSRFFGPIKSLITSLLFLTLIFICFATQSKIGDDSRDRSRLSIFVDSFSITSQYALLSQQVWSSINRDPKSTKRRSRRCQERVSYLTGTQPLYTAMPPLTDNSVEKESTPVSSSSSSSAAAVSPAYIIDNLSQSLIVGDAIFQKISDMCIDVFFKELLDPSGNGNINFVKQWQVDYLKNLQAADLRRRRERCRDANEMFLAYEIKRVTGMATVLSKPLLLDDELGRVINLKKVPDEDHGDDNYVRGDLIGFVEVTQRPYGLGSSLESPSIPLSSEIAATENDNPFGRRMINDRPLRPVLTNLAVLKRVRRYGVGTKLVDSCEKHVREQWDMNEIVLEVEDYNTKGLEFYRRRGFNVLFSDPASKRYDIDSGWWLKKVRCRREIMRKAYNDRQPSLKESADNIVRRIRESVGNF